jgi:hypothetical protein
MVTHEGASVHHTSQEDRHSKMHPEWERHALRELYKDYEYTLRERKIKLRSAAIELFDSETYWGKWDPQVRTIFIARKLLTKFSWFHVLGVLRHEMAHQLVDESRSSFQTRPHGEEFREACQRLGIPTEFSRASVNLQECDLDWRTEKRDDEAERMLEKVRKLLALANSTNEHEALLAMNRVREIYAKYNLEHATASESNAFVHIIISSGKKRVEAHERMVQSILVSHFFVQVITGETYDAPSGEHVRYAEIIGTRENALMAEYVYHFLLRQSETLIEQVVASTGKKLSRVERKSYRLGILAGFADKLGRSEGKANAKSSTRGNPPESQNETVISKAIVAFRKDTRLDSYLAGVYPRLRTTRQASQTVEIDAYSAGRALGEQITLHKPMTSSAGNLGRLLK